MEDHRAFIKRIKIYVAFTHSDRREIENILAFIGIRDGHTLNTYNANVKYTAKLFYCLSSDKLTHCLSLEA